MLCDLYCLSAIIVSVSAGIEIAYELGIYVPMNLPLGRLKMWASVPEIIVNVPSESAAGMHNRVRL